MATSEPNVPTDDRRELSEAIEALLRPEPVGRHRWASREFMLGAASGIALPVLALLILALWLSSGGNVSAAGYVGRPEVWLLAVAAVIAGFALAVALATLIRTRRQRRANTALHDRLVARLAAATGSLAELEAAGPRAAPQPDMTRSARVDRALIRLQLQQIERYLGSRWMTDGTAKGYAEAVEAPNAVQGGA